MKIKDGYILDSIGEQKVAISLEDSKDRFSGMIKLNPVAAFLWEQLLEETDENALLNAVIKKYNVDSETAAKDIKVFVDKLDKNGILER